MMQVGTNQSATYHSQPSLGTSSGQTGRSSSTSRQQQSQYDNDQLANIRPRLCLLRKWPHYDGYGVHLARNQHWLGLRIGDVEPNSPAESGGLLREDVVLAVNGHSVENDDFFVILSFIQHELEDDQIRFLVLDPHSADLARRHNLVIDENYRTCVRMETPTLTVSPEKLLYDQWRNANNLDPSMAQNTIHLGPTLSLNQPVNGSQQYEEKPSNGGPDVYTFLPYSDYAVENGKSFFDILFQQQGKPSLNDQQHLPPQEHSTQKRTTEDSTGDTQDNKNKSQASNIDHGVKNLVNPDIGTVKSVPPTKDDHNEKNESDSTNSINKISGEPTDRKSAFHSSPSLMNKHDKNVEKPNSTTKTNDYENISQPYDRLWQTSSKEEDTNNNLKLEPRMCSLTLRPGIDTIGISLQPDKDFGHIIKHVEPKSLADRAGIEGEDCIVSLNDTPLLNVPYEDVLSTLKRSRNESNLDFLVAKKSYLLKSRQKNVPSSNIQPDLSEKYTDTVSNTAAEVMPSSNLSDRDTSSTAGAAEALEQLYNKYAGDKQSSLNDQNISNRPKETVSTTTNGRYDRVSPQSDDNQYTSKPQQGQILHGVGPATADRSSWGVSSGKSTDLPASLAGDSSIRSNARGHQPDTDDIKGRTSGLEDSFKPLQVGITNQTPSQQTGNISPTSQNNRTSRPTSSVEHQDISPKALPISETTPTSARGEPASSRQNQSIQILPVVVPVVAGVPSSIIPDHEHISSQIAPSSQADLRLGPTNPISAPSKAMKTNVPVPFYDEDTDDDDLSDISEKSREDDTSEPVSNKPSQVKTSETANKDRAAPYSESVRAGEASGAPTPSNPISVNEPLNSNKDLDNKQPASSTLSDPNEQPYASLATGKTIVRARRLEQSDSEDTTSGADSHTAGRSAGDTFYSPDESMADGNDTDDQRAKSQALNAQQPNSQVKTSDNAQKQSLSKPSNQQQYDEEDDEEEEDEEEEEDSDQASEEKNERISVPKGKMALATMPVSELKNIGYEFHNIQLMQPTETSPVGLKLTKQQDPLQYIITAVAKGTKADLAGLKVNDWLIKIEDSDIRAVEFSEVSREIRELLTNAGLINMVIARKKAATTITPAIQQIEKDTRAASSSSSSRPDSLSRQQGGQIPASLLTTDITRDTPDNSQVRFVPERSLSPPAVQSQRSPTSDRGSNVNAPGGPYSVGLTNPIPDEHATKSPRSQSRSPSHSPIREYTVTEQEKKSLSEPEDYDEKDVRVIVLKEALGLDFNSFIPEGDSLVQTHFISNVQPSSMADKAGLRDGDRILTVNGADVTHAIHEDVRRMMQTKKPLTLTVVNDPKYVDLIKSVKRQESKPEGNAQDKSSPPPSYETVELKRTDSNNRSRSPVKPLSSDSTGDLKPSRSTSASPKIADNDGLSKYLRTLFTDDKGPVKVKHCILRKEPTYNGYGLVLRYQSGLHLIDQVEENSPAFNAGLREDDIILYVDKKNVEQFTHDDVKILIRKLSVSNTDIDLILIKKSDVPRYKSYEDKNKIDWQSILEDKPNSEVTQTSQSRSISTPVSNEQPSGGQRKSSSSSNKSAAPVAPRSSTTKSTNRVCTLYPSAERTAGFALSGKTSPPYVICQVEAGSPAEKAGLRLNDAVLSINGKPVTETTYEETVKIIKEALQKKSVEIVVRERSQSEDSNNNQDRTKFSLGSNDSSISVGKDATVVEPSQQGANAVEEYQKLRNKELSYTLRLCHLHLTNADGSPASTFGFELSEEPDYEYPLILRVESQSAAEGAGLQSGDVLLKINERKTKGLGYEKVKKEIDKAKRDGRLEMLVVDQETFDYCEKEKKPFKEPEMKVKHIFPKSRSSASFHKLPSVVMTSTSSITTRDRAEQLSNSNPKPDDSLALRNPTAVSYHLSTPRETDSENEDDDQNENSPDSKALPTIDTAQNKTARSSHPTVSFQISPPASEPSNVTAHSRETPLKFFDPAQTSTQQRGTSSTPGQDVPNTSRSTTTLSATATKEQKPSRAKSIPNAINNLFHKIGHSKSSKLDYDTTPKAKVSSKQRAPSPPTVRVGNNRVEESRVSQSLDITGTSTTTAPISAINDTVRSTISTGSFDYVRGPRRCVLRVDRNKGLGFVLSATGDYDHTITAVEKFSAADIAGLQINDEVLEVDGVNVRNVKYEQVVEMLVSAMRVNDTIEMCVIDGTSRNGYSSNVDIEKQTNRNNLLNSNNNNNNTHVPTVNHSQNGGGVSSDDLSDINSSNSPFDSLNQQKITTSYPNLPGQLKNLDYITNRALSGSVPALSTGITASPNSLHLAKNISVCSEKGSITKLSDISTNDAPVARLCRVRKFATSPFYGFFLCGDPKKLGRVFISDVTKHSPAAVCGLRDGDRIIEINGSATDGLTYETILDKIKHHMGRDDLELLVLDKKSVQWYRERNYPITSRTLPTIVHIEPIINENTSETQSSDIPATHTKLVGFADRRVSKTGL